MSRWLGRYDPRFHLIKTHLDEGRGVRNGQKNLADTLR